MKTVSVRDLSHKGVSRIVATAEREPVLVSKNNEPAVWMLSAVELSRVASLDGGDDVYQSAMTLVAVDLFRRDVLSLGKAARLAGMDLADFIELCGAMHVPVLREPPEGFESELVRFEAEMSNQAEE